MERSSYLSAVRNMILAVPAASTWSRCHHLTSPYQGIIKRSLRRLVARTIDFGTSANPPANVRVAPFNGLRILIAFTNVSHQLSA